MHLKDTPNSIACVIRPLGSPIINHCLMRHNLTGSAGRLSKLASESGLLGSLAGWLVGAARDQSWRAGSRELPVERERENKKMSSD